MSRAFMKLCLRQYNQGLYNDGFLCLTCLFASRGFVLGNKGGLQYPGCVLLEVDDDLNGCDFLHQFPL